MPKRIQTGHWRRTRLLAIAVTFAWIIIGFALPFFAQLSNRSQDGGTGVYVFVSEAVMILMLALVIWFVRRQRSIDGEFAMAEED